VLVFMITSIVIFSALDNLSGTVNGANINRTISTSRHLLISFGAGIAYTVLLYGTMGISGGHLNPVITVASVLTKRMAVSRASLYIFAQVLGAIFGAGCTRACLPVIFTFGFLY
jgi:glycerol uptake facilitator-like aquaporin